VFEADVLDAAAYLGEAGRLVDDRPQAVVTEVLDALVGREEEDGLGPGNRSQK
jgi:hypothetical protein